MSTRTDSVALMSTLPASYLTWGSRGGNRGSTRPLSGLSGEVLGCGCHGDQHEAHMFSAPVLASSPPLSCQGLLPYCVHLFRVGSCLATCYMGSQGVFSGSFAPLEPRLCRYFVGGFINNPVTPQSETEP